MYRPIRPQLNAPQVNKRGQHFNSGPTRRTPEDFQKAQPRFQTTQASQPSAALRNPEASVVNKWKNSFTAVGKDNKDTNPSSDNGSKERSQIYNSYEPDTDEPPSTASHSDSQEPPGRSDMEAGLKRRRLSPGPPVFSTIDSEATTQRRNYKHPSGYTGIDKVAPHRQEVKEAITDKSQIYDPYEPDSDEPPSPATHSDSQEPLGRRDIEAGIERRRLSPGPPLFSSVDSKSTDRAGYSSGGRAVDHRALDIRPETTTQLRDFKHPSGYTGRDQVPSHRQEPGNMEAITNKNLISCDLCEVELANGQELEEHLDSKIHWDTLEHIQKHNGYDDMTIGFLQDVMLYKSRKCSRAIEDSALLALQQYDHMTKVEMFHCAACDVFVSTSAAGVQSHIFTQEHIFNTKEFEVRQRRTCLDKASTMMKELQPQFVTFLKGDCPFE